MWQQKHRCSLLLGRLQTLPAATQYHSALLSVSSAQKLGEEFEKRTTMEPCTEKYFHPFPPHPLKFIDLKS